VLVAALLVLLALLRQQPELSRSERTERDTSPCTLLNGELAAALVELVRQQGTPEPELKAAHEAIGKAMTEHGRRHGWPDSLEQRVPPSSCPGEAVDRLTEIGVQLAMIGRQSEVERIAEILERSGRPANAISLLSCVPSVSDETTGPSGPVLPGWKPRRFSPCEERLAAIERRQGHWQSALDHYTAWPALSSCGNGAVELQQRREMNRLECLAALGRWEEYREICRAQICDGGWVFTTHLIESYRAQGTLACAPGDLELTLQSYATPATRNASQRPQMQKEHEGRLRKARERACVQLMFLQQEESGDLGELPELLRSGLPFDVALAGFRRLGSRGVAQLIALTNDAFQDPEILGRLLRLLALTGDPQVQAFLTASEVQARIDPSLLPYLLTYWNLARQGVDVRRTLDKGLYLPE